MKINGFTLAEVLIALVVIGIVSAITIPSLINKTNNEEAVSKLKKTYSTLSQATNQIIAEEGTSKASVGGWADNSEHVYQLYKSRLNNTKECGNTTKCFDQIKDVGYKRLDGKGFDTAWVEGSLTRRLILADGVQITFLHKSDTCEFDTYSRTNRCVEIGVDVNGAKKPNTWGRDAFRFAITDKGLQPYGCDIDCIEQGGGSLCACKVLRESAINY